MAKRRLFGVLCLVAGVAGCSAPPEQGRTPTTAQECREDYDAAKQRIRQAGSSGGHPIGVAIGVGISKGVYERRYQECLISVGGGLSAGRSTRPTQSPSVPVQRDRNGRYPLPSQYALMPGDAAIWQQLTAAEQERALLFLKDGSTIRSSLQGDD
ncbi:hypothetical protein [Pseudophaeobacter sp. EL27]|uniref:hypothetical protein n=1 Tax=Pseudophaeobacter sp. EL27 TaxID=2107580 RepID=UPI0013C50D4B|nr:hypothetical protein [Pseudophaeobacter sp. EL27]